MKISKRKVVDTLKAVTDYAARDMCLHEETYRGGTIWEVCSSCGMKWADDRGGKPTVAHDLPVEITNAYDLLNQITSG